jgi:hypothetical protein
MPFIKPFALVMVTKSAFAKYSAMFTHTKRYRTLFPLFKWIKQTLNPEF